MVDIYLSTCWEGESNERHANRVVSLRVILFPSFFMPHSAAFVFCHVSTAALHSLSAFHANSFFICSGRFMLLKATMNDHLIFKIEVQS